MSASDPIAATHDYAVRLFALVEAGQANVYDVMAALVSDTLALSMHEQVRPDVADQLLEMACDWSVQRQRALLAEGALRRDPVPDDVRALLEDDQGQV